MTNLLLSARHLVHPKATYNIPIPPCVSTGAVKLSIPSALWAVPMIYTKHNSDWILEQEHVSITIFTGAEMPRQSISFFCSSDTVYSSLSFINNIRRLFVYCFIVWIKTKVYCRPRRFISPVIILDATVYLCYCLLITPSIECWH